MQVKTHNGEVYAVFNKKFSNFGLYEGKDGEDFLPYQSSSKFCPKNQDSKFIAGLRKWLVDFQFDEGILKSRINFIDKLKFTFVTCILYIHPSITMLYFKMCLFILVNASI